MQLKINIIFQIPLPVFSETKIEIKSVPPLVAPERRQEAIATPLVIPPKILHRRMSSVIIIAGIKSVRIPEAMINQIESVMHFLPRVLKHRTAGMRLNVQ